MVIVGDAETVAPVVADNPVAGVQTYVDAPVAAKVAELPVHTATPEPAETSGVAFIVTTAVAVEKHVVYEIVAVPAVLPVTTPDVPMLATVGLLLLHVPPAAEFDSVDVAPAHIDVVPVIAAEILILLQVGMAPVTKFDEPPVSARLYKLPQLFLPL